MSEDPSRDKEHGLRNTGHLGKYGTVGHSMLGLVNTCVSKEVSK